ncbi:MAG: hypothetical protein IMY71_10900, partial [Bacteroidetes bacterium]|nr:hypothetical protein [Bacteroidota bacterium]
MKLSDKNITRKLDELLIHQDYEKAPEDFSDKVMSDLHPYLADVKSQYTPLISKRAWILIGVLLLILFILASVFPSNTETWFDIPLDYLSGLIERSISIYKISINLFNNLDTSFLFPVIIPSFILLIIFDRLIHFVMK